MRLYFNIEKSSKFLNQTMKNIGCLSITLLFGLPFFLVGLLAAYNEYSFFKNATASSEGIVSNVISVVGKKGTTYKCVYSYTTKTG
jgi:hypothetical protein